MPANCRIIFRGHGSGGGHYEKAGGYISMKLYEEKYPTLHSEALFFNNRMTQHFDTFGILYRQRPAIPGVRGARYQRKKNLWPVRGPA